jgi:hypothetical protein
MEISIKKIKGIKKTDNENLIAGLSFLDLVLYSLIQRKLFQM